MLIVTTEDSEYSVDVLPLDEFIVDSLMTFPVIPTFVPLSVKISFHSCRKTDTQKNFQQADL